MITIMFTGNLLLTTMCPSSTTPKILLWLTSSKEFISSNSNIMDITNPFHSCSSSLRGKKDIVVALFPLPPFVTYLPKHKYTGAEVQVFDILAKKVGFNYRYREESTYMLKNHVTGNWTGIIGSVS